MIKPIPPVVPNIFEDFKIYDKNVKPKEEPAAFSEIIKEAIREVNNLQIEAQNKNVQLSLGEIKDVHEVMIAGERAALALDLTLEIRNRVIEAYQQIMRMAV